MSVGFLLKDADEAVVWRGNRKTSKFFFIVKCMIVEKNKFNMMKNYLSFLKIFDCKNFKVLLLCIGTSERISSIQRSSL